MVFKVLIQRMLGRYALQSVKDFAGIFIFSAWNAYGTEVILKEARVIIMGQNLIEQVVAKIKVDQEPTPEFKAFCMIHSNTLLSIKETFTRTITC